MSSIDQSVQRHSLPGTHVNLVGGARTAKQKVKVRVDDTLPFCKFSGVISPMVDLAEAVSRAKRWTSSYPRGIEVSSVRESERRIDLTSQRGSFFVTVPPSDQEEWVWLSYEDHALTTHCLCFISCRAFGVMRRSVLST